MADLTSKQFSVSLIQSLLKERNYDVPVDGVFESKTQRAVVLFQKDENKYRGFPLRTDGVVDEETYIALIGPRRVP